MKIGSGWKPIGLTVFVLAIMLALAAVFGTGRGAVAYDRAAQAVPIETPSRALGVPDAAYDDALTAQEWTAWAALIGAVAGISSLMVLVLTLLTTRDMLQEARKTTDAALGAVEATREIGRKQIAAYLSVTDLDVTLPSGSQHPQYRASIKNTGNSPATDVEAVFCITLSAPQLHQGDLDPEITTHHCEYWFARSFKDLQSGEETKVDWIYFPTFDRIGKPISNPTSNLVMTIQCRVFATDVFGHEISAHHRSTVHEPQGPDSAFTQRKVIDAGRIFATSVHLLRDEHFRKRLRKRRSH